MYRELILSNTTYGSSSSSGEAKVDAYLSKSRTDVQLRVDDVLLEGRLEVWQMLPVADDRCADDLDGQDTVGELGRDQAEDGRLVGHGGHGEGVHAGHEAHVIDGCVADELTARED